MNSENEINKSIQRLMQVNWRLEYDYDKHDIYKLHIREWLRRMTLWGKALNATQKWPFISVADEIFGKPEVSEPVFDEIISFLLEHANTYTTLTSIWYVRWSGVKNRKELTQFNLRDPYEPLILFLEIGGWLRKEQNFLDGVMITIDNWQEYDLLEPFISLDKESTSQTQDS